MSINTYKSAIAKEYRRLPQAVSFRKSVGPGVILLATAMGSGEIFFWPGIAAEYGFQLIWLTFFALGLQYVLNTEFIRYTLATGEPVVNGFSRLWAGFGWFLLAAAILPWMWPGWAMGGATALSWVVGGDPVWIGSVSLLAIGALLTTTKVVYQALELSQKLLISFVLLVALFLATAVVRMDSITEIGQGFISSPLPLPENLSVLTLLAALAFCGAGGTINLVASNWARDKGLGMADHAPKIENPFTGELTAQGQTRYFFTADEENVTNWNAWWLVVRREQVITFFLAGAIGLVLFMLIAHTLIGGQGHGVGMGAVEAQANVLGSTIGGWLKITFALCVASIFLTSAIGVLDHSARLSAGLIKLLVPKIQRSQSKHSSESGLYFIVLWTMIGFGLFVLLALDVTSPPILLTVAGALSGVVMFVYSTLMIWLNSRMKKAVDLRDAAFGESNPFNVEVWRKLSLYLSVLLYGVVSIVVVYNVLSKIG